MQNTTNFILNRNKEHRNKEHQVGIMFVIPEIQTDCLHEDDTDSEYVPDTDTYSASVTHCTQSNLSGYFEEVCFIHLSEILSSSTIRDGFVLEYQVYLIYPTYAF